jgi:hypothetical protein
VAKAPGSYGPKEAEGPATDAAVAGASGLDRSEHNWSLQMIVQLTADVGKLTAKVDRLIDDQKGIGEKVDTVRHTVSFVRGAVWVIGGIIAVAIFIVGLYLSGRLSITIIPPKG